MLLITLWQSNYNEAMKYKLKVQTKYIGTETDSYR